MVEKCSSNQINALDITYLWIVHAISDKDLFEHVLKVLIFRESLTLSVGPLQIFPNLLQMNLGWFFFLKFYVKFVVWFPIVWCPLLSPHTNFSTLTSVLTWFLFKPTKYSQLVKPKHRLDIRIVQAFTFLGSRIRSRGLSFTTGNNGVIGWFFSISGVI